MYTSCIVVWLRTNIASDGELVREATRHIGNVSEVNSCAILHGIRWDFPSEPEILYCSSLSSCVRGDQARLFSRRWTDQQTRLYGPAQPVWRKRFSFVGTRIDTYNSPTTKHYNLTCRSGGPHARVRPDHAATQSQPTIQLELKP